MAGRRAYVRPSKYEWEELVVHRLLDGLVRGTKAAMTRVEVGGTLYFLAVIGVLLTSRAGESGS